MTEYYMRISDSSSDVCSSDLLTKLASARRRGVYETVVIVLFFQTALQADRRFGTDELREDLAVVADLLDDVVAPLVVDAQHLTHAAFHAEQAPDFRSEEHTSELQSLMRISYAVFCLTKKNNP